MQIVNPSAPFKRFNILFCWFWLIVYPFTDMRVVNPSLCIDGAQPLVYLPPPPPPRSSHFPANGIFTFPFIFVNHSHFTVLDSSWQLSLLNCWHWENGLSSVLELLLFDHLVLYQLDHMIIAQAFDFFLFFLVPCKF